jgi:hypothetical protein
MFILLQFQSNVVGTATLLRFGRSRARILMGSIYSSPKRSDRLLFSLNRVFLQGLKQLGCDFSHSSPSSAEVKNEWIYTPSSPIYLHGVGSNYIIVHKTGYQLSQNAFASSLYNSSIAFCVGLSKDVFTRPSGTDGLFIVMCDKKSPPDEVILRSPGFIIVQLNNGVLEKCDSPIPEDRENMLQISQ